MVSGYITSFTCDALWKGGGVIVKFSHQICIDLIGVPDRGWGSKPLDLSGQCCT